MVSSNKEGKGVNCGYVLLIVEGKERIGRNGVRLKG
jgi:hypothetical protein